MLRITASKSAKGAASYYGTALRKEDYYAQGKGNEVVAVWSGIAAEKLGLVAGGAVTKEAFVGIMSNRHPQGGKITPRQNGDGKRVPYWDLTFNCPKSFSILNALTGDPELQKSFEDSVDEVMLEVEKSIGTRIRKGGQQDVRPTANGLWANFYHGTTRPVDGTPDCHSHCHAVLANLTFDSAEGRFKAIHLGEIKDKAHLFEALFHSKLSQRLSGMGYSIIRTAKGWEIEGLHSASLLRKFSRRTAEIEKLASDLKITDAKLKSQLGATSRKGKQKQLSETEMVKEWRSRLTPEESSAIDRVHARTVPPSRPKATAEEYLEFASEKLFERASVVPRDKVYSEALRYGYGSVGLDEIKRGMKDRGFIEKTVGGENLVTTIKLVAEECQLIAKCRDGRKSMAPIMSGPVDLKEGFLSKEQQEAVRHILQSNDQVIALRGRAGVGKTTLLSAVKENIEREGKFRVFAFAPSADAARKVLRDDGFQGAETVARLLVDKELQKKVRGQIILLDEAGTIGGPSLAKVFAIAGDSTRIILSGDTGQHSPVERADSMRLLEEYAGLPVATVRQIVRQEKEGYRRAVSALAEGDLATGFSRLDEIGAIREIRDESARYRTLALDYATCLAETGIAPLVVSPTHAEGREVTNAIRRQLSEDGKLGTERGFRQYRSLQWEEVEKTRPENYESGMVVQFHQNAKGGIKRGSLLSVVDRDDHSVWIEKSGERVALDLKEAGKFRVYEVDALNLAPGDLLRVTNGGTSANGRRLNNGDVGKIDRISREGKITLTNGVMLNADHGHIAHAYCSTSHSSQGKSVPTVFVAQSAMSMRAASREGFYVSTSRGKQEIRIFTDNRNELLEAVTKSSRRLSALEFTGAGKELFMSGKGLAGKEWVERIAAESAKRQEKLASKVEKLVAERRINPPQGKINSFVAYVEMRRANSGADGKNRNKGQPAPKNAKPKKGLTDPRRVEMRESTKEKVAGKKNSKAKEPEAGKSKKAEKARKTAKVHRAEKKIRGSRKQFKKVLEANNSNKKGKGESQAQVQFGKTSRSPGKLNGPKATKSQAERRAKSKPPQPPKPKPPAPVIRRGR